MMRIYMVLSLAAFLTIFFFASISFAFTDLFSFLVKSGKKGQIEWEDKGPTPLGDKKYTPQGMTFVNGAIVFANSWKDTNSRVYEIDPDTMAVNRYFDMPKEAVHTSGLAWDGTFLWGVDYKSNLAYCMDMVASFEKQKAVLKGSFDTTFKGTSASCFVMFKGQRYLAISDFMNTRQTIFVEFEKALKAGTAKDCIVFAYKNEGFSQGLEYFDGHLYESENKIGTNIINKMDMDLLEKTNNARKATVVQYPAPSKGVEDLAWTGRELWTSDETVFRFFKGRF